MRAGARLPPRTRDAIQLGQAKWSNASGVAADLVITPTTPPAAAGTPPQAGGEEGRGRQRMPISRGPPGIEWIFPYEVTTN